MLRPSLTFRDGSEFASAVRERRVMTHPSDPVQMRAVCGGEALGIHLVENASALEGDFANEFALQPTVLLVEDERFVREVTREVLRSAGYRVVAVRTAVEALRVFEEVGAAVDLLLTDIVLPGETGLELAARLRRAKHDLKILYVTGYAEQMKRCGEQGERFLAKPFSSEKLLGAVGQALSTSEANAVSISGMTAAESRFHHLARNV